MDFFFGKILLGFYFGYLDISNFGLKDIYKGHPSL